MALKQIEKHKWNGYQARNIPDLINPYHKEDIFNRNSISVVNPTHSMEFLNDNAYQNNIIVDNREIPRLIQSSKPAYVQNTELLKPIIFNRDPQDKYVSFRI